MNTYLTNHQGAIVLASFIAVMFIIVALGKKLNFIKFKDLNSFLVADRKVGTISGALSIAATFVWAPALFVSSKQAFVGGISGVFWFIIPNIICLLVSAYVGMKIRQRHPEGFTLTKLIFDKTGSKLVHIPLLGISLLWMMLAVVINIIAGGQMLAVVSGIPYWLSAGSLIFIALIYSMIGGIRSSIVTDAFQMGIMLLAVLIIVPLTLNSAFIQNISLSDGLGGTSGSMNPFDWGTFYGFGFLAIVGLTGGWLQDQTYYQRVFSIKKEKLFKTFLLAAVLFTIVPLGLSLLGFTGASLVNNGLVEIADANAVMIAPIVVGHFLSTAFVMLFVLMVLCGLASTLDSALCAVSSLFAMDIDKAYLTKDKISDKQAISRSRIAMIIFAIVGLAISLGKFDLTVLFLLYAAIAIGGLVPILYIIFDRVPKTSYAFIAIIGAFSIAIPTSILGASMANPHLSNGGIVLAALLSIIICEIGYKKRAM